MKDLISIIVPVFNVEKYLSKCLETLTAQTYENLEIILIDDGSTDRSKEICDEWKILDNRIIVIHQNNKGVSTARNTALELCNGEYIGFVDGDDWCELQMYEALLNSIKESDSDVAMCGFVDYPNGIDNPIEKGTSPLEPCDYENAIEPILKHKGYFVSLWNKLFKRSIIFEDETAILMDPDLDYGEDEVWLFEIISKAKRISFVPTALYHWRPREGSASRTNYLSKKQMSLLEAKKQVLSFIPKLKEMQSFAKGRVYNDCHILKVIAYCSQDENNFRVVNAFLEPLRMDWIKSRDVRTIRKIKVVVIEVLMLLKMPAAIVKKISDLR